MNDITSRRWIKSYSTRTPLAKSLGGSGYPTKAHCPEAIIVHPGADYEGDIIHPDGGNWDRFDRNPVVNWDHGPYIGTATVVLKSIPLYGDDDQPTGEFENVPVGCTKLFTSAADLKGLQLPRYDERGNVIGQYDPNECLRTADRVAGRIVDGLFDGVSVELLPKGKIGGPFFKSLGPSPLGHRDSYEIREWYGLGYAHCVDGIHPSARQITDGSGYYAQKIEKCIRTLESMPDGTPYLRKSLTRFVDRATGKPKRITVPVRLTKAPPPPATDDEDYTFPAGGATDGTDDIDDGSKGTPQQDKIDPEDSPDAEPVPPGVKTLLTLAQDVMDACGRATETAKLSDNPKLKTYMMREIAWLTKKAARVAAYADALGQSLMNGGGDPPEPDEDAEGQPDKPETDDDGGIITKSFPTYRPRRLKKSDLGPPVRKVTKLVPTPTDVTVSADDAKLMAEIKRKLSMLSL